MAKKYKSKKFIAEYSSFLKEHIKDKSIFENVSDEEYLLLFDKKSEKEYNKILETAKLRYESLKKLQEGVQYAESYALAHYMNEMNKIY